MDTAASLAFFQNLYTGVSLYVVPEPAAAAVPAPVATPLPAPAPVAAAPAAAGVPAAPAPRPAPVAAAPVPPARVPVPSVVPPAAAPPVVAAADMSAAGPLFNVATLAALPAAPAAPPSQPGRIQPTPTQSPVAHIPFATLGSNPNGLLILVRVSPEEFKKLPRNVFLNNILKAIRLVMEDVVLVNVEHEKFPVALCSLRQQLAAQQFLAFGKNLLDVAVYTTQPYEPVLLYGDTAFLGASEIKMLEYDAGRKKQLWQSMQRMFL
ncbi:hypothetical protein KBK19_16515 [Microvirga sp. STR05]|uniref:Uncharacterized protein n=1 Tax=Hymenobacter duratus TaxID=2771356 RepID=A0ABR8JQ24_9BACT|nr:hypothetical protein [Hymenobacter duratus]MBD2716649.1 hypothetical protein [Hymenobacter duratus]MBR7951564.1 hypothetical protein [Microvirga sp. STR05]